jgi:predicted RND superfamily exporter protein
MVKQYKYPIVGLFVVWTVFASIFASKLTPLTQEEKFLPEDHQIEVIQKTVTTQY